MEPARRRSISATLWLLMGISACGLSGEGGPGGSAVVEVALPTGDPAQDRPAILRALARVEPGGTVQFAPGLYVVGEVVSVTTDRVTPLGHPDGTIYRGHPGGVHGTSGPDPHHRGLDRTRVDLAR